MARNCKACSDLQENSADFVVNGVTKEVCNSLKNNTGFDTSSGHDDCTDLDYANDCLVGNMENEVDAYKACDWKEFIKKFIYNIWTVLKAMICAICGLWKIVDRHECEINRLFDGYKMEIGEEGSNDSYIKAGGGVSYKYDSEETGERVSDVQCLYIGGGLLRVQGTFRFYQDDFPDKDGTARQGNHNWGTTGPCVAGGELICEIRVKKSQFGIKNIYAGFGQETGGGHYSINATVFSEGEYAYGQHGSCNADGTVDPGSDHSTGHKVKDGYIYIQLRMSYIGALHAWTPADGFDLEKVPPHYSPRCFLGIRFNKNNIC